MAVNAPCEPNIVYGIFDKMDRHTTHVAAPLKLSLVALMGSLLLTPISEIYTAVPVSIPPETMAVNFRNSCYFNISIAIYFLQTILLNCIIFFRRYTPPLCLFLYVV